MIARDKRQQADRVVGAVLAGGRGRRIGGDKAVVGVNGIPLIEYPLAVLSQLDLEQTVVVAKRTTTLPSLTERFPIWVEPDTPRHPLCGLAHALRRANGRWVLAVAADMPLLDVGTLRRLLGSARPDDLAVMPVAAGRPQPLAALYSPGALRHLACFAADVRLTEAVATLRPRLVECEDADSFFNVNAPEDVLRASATLAARNGLLGRAPSRT